jgi:hypothetical protein
MDSLFTQLDREWAHFRREPAVVAALRPACALAGVASPAVLTDAVRAATPEQADAVLLHLATESVDGSKIAARSLLQLLLPGTCRLAARWWALGDAEERAACAVAAVYERIRRYPIERRPRRVAANILLDAGQDLWRASKRATQHATHTVNVDPQLLPTPRSEPDPTPAEELTWLVLDAVEEGIIRIDEAHLILATRVGNDDLPAIARRRGAKLRTLQWRRQTAEATLVAQTAVA